MKLVILPIFLILHMSSDLTSFSDSNTSIPPSSERGCCRVRGREQRKPLHKEFELRRQRDLVFPEPSWLIKGEGWLFPPAWSSHRSQSTFWMTTRLKGGKVSLEDSNLWYLSHPEQNFEMRFLLISNACLKLLLEEGLKSWVRGWGRQTEQEHDELESKLQRNF